MIWAPYIAELQNKIKYSRSRCEYTGVLEAKLDTALRAQYANSLSEHTGQHHCLQCFEPFVLGKGPCKKPKKRLPPEVYEQKEDEG